MKTCFVVGVSYADFPFSYFKNPQYVKQMKKDFAKKSQAFLEEGFDHFIFLDEVGANIDFFNELIRFKEQYNFNVSVYKLGKKYNAVLSDADEIIEVSYKFPLFKKKRLWKNLLKQSDYLYLLYYLKGRKNDAKKIDMLSFKMDIRGDLYDLSEVTEEVQKLRRIFSSIGEKYPSFVEELKATSEKRGRT